MAAQASLNMLRAIALSVQPSESYDARLVRRVRVEQGRDRLSYWFPAIIGAGIASFATFALMQLVTARHSVQPFLNGRSAEARNTLAPDRAAPRLLLGPELTAPTPR